MHYAHSLRNQPVDKWQPLETHLQNVANLAAEFAKPFGGEEWTYLVGLWHDLGKYSDAFQAYLRHENEIIDDFTQYYKGRVDHSTFGAQFSYNLSKDAGKCLAYILAGHHTGLLNWLQDSQHGLSYRLEKQIEPIKKNIANNAITNPTFLKIDPDRIGFQLQFFIRMIFSCLVDADFLDTEKFIKPERWKYRINNTYLNENHVDQFWQKLNNLRQKAPDTTINQIRETILKDCIKAASNNSSLFSLTVPTGGGKTLSSMAFALEHAKKYNKQRIIYVIPFTSIIEQNAQVFRNMLGNENVLEHHSNFEPDETNWQNKLAAENWAAPVIVTTNVQFFNSLFAKKTSKCRKLHHIANSVIIFDEAQAIPVEKLQPCIEAIKELSLNYNVTSVLCTATQPALQKNNHFALGLENVSEIVSNVKHLFQILKRTQISSIGIQNANDIAKKLLQRKQALCIVNTRKQAREIFEKMDPNESYHLSALMYPAHRSKVLSEIKDSLNNRKNSICRVISTQLIEAGVDIDFPTVFRSIAGIDSIAQAAGRCNREGKLKTGNVFVFTPEEGIPPGYFRQTTQCASALINKFPDQLIEPECIQEYFLNYYWLNQNRMDDADILMICKTGIKGNIQFEDIAQFQLIKNATNSIVIAIEKEAIQWVESLKYIEFPTQILRKLQKYSVQIYPYHMNQIIEFIKEPYPGVKVIYDSNLYSEKLGLLIDGYDNKKPEDFIC